jgi:hypothetical protein
MFQAVFTQRGNNFIHIKENAESMDEVAESILKNTPSHVTPINEICVYMIELKDSELSYLGYVRGLLVNRMEKENIDDISYGLNLFGVPENLYFSLCESADDFGARNFFSISDFCINEEDADSGLGSFMLSMLPWVLENNTNLHIDMICLNLNLVSVILNSTKLVCVENDGNYSWKAKYTDDLVDTAIKELTANIVFDEERDADGKLKNPVMLQVYREIAHVANEFGATDWLNELLDLYKENSQFYYDSVRTVWEEDCAKLLHLLKKNDYVLGDKRTLFFVKTFSRDAKPTAASAETRLCVGIKELENTSLKFNW